MCTLRTTQNKAEVMVSRTKTLQLDERAFQPQYLEVRSDDFWNKYIKYQHPPIRHFVPYNFHSSWQQKYFVREIFKYWHCFVPTVFYSNYFVNLFSFYFMFNNLKSYYNYIYVFLWFSFPYFVLCALCAYMGPVYIVCTLLSHNLNKALFFKHCCASWAWDFE